MAWTERREAEVKHPLARALRGAGVEPADVAARLQVDPKTVQRWLAGRLPYPRHRATLVALTGWPARDLWPGADALAPIQSEADEVRVVYPQRSAVPTETWRQMFRRADHEIGILAYSGLFLAEDTGVHTVLREKARAGVRVRIVLGDAGGAHVARRGSDEGIDVMMHARIRNALILFRPLAEEAGVSLRLHDTVLYNSIYRADNELMINTHAYGCPASHAPVLHLHRTGPDGIAATYLDSFERVWSAAHDSRAQPTNRSKSSAAPR
jgi:hypothetical protein